MSRPLFQRIRTLLSADAHGLVESLEDRQLMLKQYVREAELELVRKRARVDALADDEKCLRDELARCEDELRTADADVDLAIEGGEDDLARFALRRVLGARAREQALRGEIGARAAERTAIEERLREQEQRFEALRARVRAEQSRPDEAPEDWLGEPVVADEQIEIELLRRKRASRAGGAS
jgi:phage shock protein A